MHIIDWLSLSLNFALLVCGFAVGVCAGFRRWEPRFMVNYLFWFINSDIIFLGRSGIYWESTQTTDQTAIKTRPHQLLQCQRQCWKNCWKRILTWRYLLFSKYFEEDENWYHFVVGCAMPAIKSRFRGSEYRACWYSYFCRKTWQRKVGFFCCRIGSTDRPYIHGWSLVRWRRGYENIVVKI